MLVTTCILPQLQPVLILCLAALPAPCSHLCPTTDLLQPGNNYKQARPDMPAMVGLD